MSYTYLTKNGSPQDCYNFSIPIEDKLYFAGEHLCFDFIGTVHGAYITGIQAGERIIASYIHAMLVHSWTIMVACALYRV